MTDLREGMASVLATALGYSPNKVPPAEWSAKRDEYLKLADAALDYLREVVDVEPDLMEQSLDAMERGDHAEGIRLARESNRHMTVLLEAKYSPTETKEVPDA